MSNSTTTKFEQAVRKAKDRTKIMNRLFIGSMGGLIFLFLLILAILVGYILDQQHGSVFDFAAVGIMILWICLMVGYYAWAIYFYNINLGLTNEDWAEIRAKSELDPSSVEVREDNPHQTQSLGLPPGTIRGTLTLTLLIAALALTISYLGDKGGNERSFYADNMEFFKTAFLMMIAFYFGSKSLEYLSRNPSKIPQKQSNSNDKEPKPSPTSSSRAKKESAKPKAETAKGKDLAEPKSEANNEAFDVPGSLG